MGNCFLHGNGYNLQNYRVKAYATEALLDAAKPLENTLGVVTETKITRHGFHAKEPDEKVEGMVWFSLAEESGLAFSALKKNTVNLNVKRCYQYISGEWVEKTVKSFVDGKWKPWKVWLWNFGDENKAVTGGWGASTLVARQGYEGDSSSGTPTILNHYADGSILYSNGNGFGGSIHTKQKVDLTDYNIVVFDGSAKVSSEANEDNCCLCVWKGEKYGDDADNLNGGGLVRKLPGFTDNYLTVRCMDIRDLVGEYFIGFDICDDSSLLRLQSLRLETAYMTGVTINDP